MYPSECVNLGRSIALQTELRTLCRDTQTSFDQLLYRQNRHSKTSRRPGPELGSAQVCCSPCWLACEAQRRSSSRKFDRSMTYHFARKRIPHMPPKSSCHSAWRARKGFGPNRCLQPQTPCTAALLRQVAALALDHSNQLSLAKGCNTHASSATDDRPWL